MKVLIGVDPHKASAALAVVDEVVGEFVECATFLQMMGSSVSRTRGDEILIQRH